MALEAFNDSDIDQLIQWISSEELNYLWAGPTYEFPLTSQQIKVHCAQTEVISFMYRLHDQNVGCIELFYIDDHHYRVCRVFIADEYRGQGMAKQMITALIMKAQTEFNCNKLSLAVFEHNLVAKQCYLSLGFRITQIKSGARYYKGKSINLVRMQKCL